MIIEQQAKLEVELQKQNQKDKLNDFMYRIHGQFVNETDFSDYSFEDIKAQSQNSLVLEKKLL